MSNCYNSELPIGPPGPTGPQGIQGLQGLDGTAWLNGAGVPDSLLGVYNDYYLDTVTGDLYVKQYVGLALEWVNTTNIYGTPGTNGDPGINGVDGTTLVYIPYDDNFFKSLGVSPVITTSSLDTTIYGTTFYIFSTDLCPQDNSIAKIYLTYSAYNGGEDTPIDPGNEATVFYNFFINGLGMTGITGNGPLPSAYYNNTYVSDSSTSGWVFTNVCYTIRRESLTTADLTVEWSSSRTDGYDLYNAQGNWSKLSGSVLMDFNPSVYTELKFSASITNSIPATSPAVNATSFYIEKLI